MYQEQLTSMKNCDSVIGAPTPAPVLSERMLCDRKKKKSKKVTSSSSSESDMFEDPWSNEDSSDF